MKMEMCKKLMQQEKHEARPHVFGQSHPFVRVIGYRLNFKDAFRRFFIP